MEPEKGLPSDEAIPADPPSGKQTDDNLMEMKGPETAVISPEASQDGLLNDGQDVDTLDFFQ